MNADPIISPIFTAVTVVLILSATEGVKNMWITVILGIVALSVAIFVTTSLYRNYKRNKEKDNDSL